MNFYFVRKLLSVFLLLNLIVFPYVLQAGNMSFEENIVPGKEELDISSDSFNFSLPWITNTGYIEDPNVKYYTSSSFGYVYALSGGLSYKVNTKDKDFYFSENFIGGNKIDKIEVGDSSKTNVSYFKGKDKEDYNDFVDTYKNIIYKNVWQGVDIVLEKRTENVEKIFVLNPESNISDIKIGFNGVSSFHLDEKNGNLILKTDSGNLVSSRPKAFQYINGKKVFFDASYLIDKDHYSFDVSGFDPSLVLYIDPFISGTFVGTSASERLQDIKKHPITGEIYVLGATNSASFPGVSGGYDDTHNLDYDIVLFRLSSDLSTLNQATYIGGSRIEAYFSSWPTYDLGQLEIANDGSVYMLTFTNSEDYPTTPGVFQTLDPLGGDSWTRRNAVLTRFNQDLTSVMYSTYFGRKNGDYDSNFVLNKTTGDVYLTLDHFFNGSGISTVGGAQPTTPNTANTCTVAKLNSSFEFVKATFLSSAGNYNDYCDSILFDETSDAVYVLGVTNGSTFSVTPGAYDTTHNGSFDYFITKLNGDLTTIIASTFVGGSSTDSNSNHVSYKMLGNTLLNPDTGDFVFSGLTWSQDFPTTLGAFQTTNNTKSSHLTVLSNDLSTLKYSTFMSNNSYTPKDLTRVEYKDTTNEYYFYQFTSLTSFSGTENGYKQNLKGSSDLVISRVSSDLSLIVQSTYVGGFGTEFWGDFILLPDNKILVGLTYNSNDLEVSTGVYDETYNEDNDIYLLIMDDSLLGPYLNEVSPVNPSVLVNVFNPSYTFQSNTSGTLSFSGRCISDTNSVVLGNNTIVFNSLNSGIYNDCRIQLIDNRNVLSNELLISPFSIVIHSGSSGSSSSNTQTNTETIIQNTEINITENNSENIQNQNTEEGINTTITENTNIISAPNTYISPLDNTEKICQAFNVYFKKGDKNNNEDQVRLWQAFLNKYENENLSMDGVFGDKTENAIKRFQNKYKDYILSPWGLTIPTGYTYQTTRAYGNKMLGCSEGVITLSNGQVVNY